VKRKSQDPTKRFGRSGADNRSATRSGSQLNQPDKFQNAEGFAKRVATHIEDSKDVLGIGETIAISQISPYDLIDDRLG
jgi:hypothetical protein